MKKPKKAPTPTPAPFGDFGGFEFKFELPQLPEMPAFNPGTSDQLPPGFDFDPLFLPERKPPLVFDQKKSYSHALALAERLIPARGMSGFFFLNGTFTWGDFLEAWIKRYNIHIKEMHVSSLSMNIENIVSIGNLIEGGYVERFVLHVSSAYAAHYKDDVAWMRKHYSKGDFAGRFQIVVARNHVKIALIETMAGAKVVFRGSANLQTSDCLDFMEVDEHPALYDFCYEVYVGMENAYKMLDLEKVDPYRGIPNKELRKVLADPTPQPEKTYFSGVKPLKKLKYGRRKQRYI